MKAATVQEAPAPYGTLFARSAAIGEQRMLLHGVKWATYKTLLNDLGDSRGCRLAFDSGDLEIMSPLYEHEGSNRPFGIIVFILAEELGLDYLDLGSLTCNRDDIEKGIEPDSCFYIANAHKISSVENRKTIDLHVDPPPDIVVEVDISSNSMKKLPICEALGVPEFWRYDGTRFEIRVLTNGRYVESESAAFPGIPLRDVLPKFLPLGKKSLLDMSRRFRAWLREHLSKSKARRTKTSKKKSK